MQILHTVAGLWETTGGPAASVPDLCRALGRAGHEVTLLTGEGPLAPAVERAADRVSVRTAPLGPYWLAHWSPRFDRACREAAEGSDLVHTHGVWLHPNWSSAAAARRLRKPLVISPRGMLEPWSLRRSRWRKKVLWGLVERSSFRGAALIHVTGEAEGQSVRRLGVEAPLAVIPNGIDVDEEFATERVARLARPREADDGADTVLFLGRIHPKKGLDLLLAAWAELAPAYPRARLVLCGPGEPAHVAALQRRVARSAAERVAYLGAVGGERKVELLARAAVLVLPSRSENYGMVVAEALACGTPVVTTTATPWQVVVERGCGWWVAPRAESIRTGLAEALERSPAERSAMGRRGRRLIEEEHALDRVAERMASAYAWALGSGPRPDWIYEGAVPRGGDSDSADPR